MDAKKINQEDLKPTELWMQAPLTTELCMQAAQ